MSLINTPLNILIIFNFIILKPNSHHLQTILNDIPSKKTCLTEHVKRVVFSGNNNSFTRPWSGISVSNEYI